MVTKNYDGYFSSTGKMARLERFELPTNWFEACFSFSYIYSYFKELALQVVPSPKKRISYKSLI